MKSFYIIFVHLYVLLFDQFKFIDYHLFSFDVIIEFFFFLCGPALTKQIKLWNKSIKKS